jgi:hypothetical protein
MTGVDYTMYKLDSGSWNLYTSPFAVSDDQIHTIEYYSVDNSGNTESVKSADFKIDQKPPMTTHTISGDIGKNGWYRNIDNIIFTPIDNTSGVAHTYYKLDSGVWAEYTTPIVITTDGAHTFEYYSIDNAGNQESIKGPFTLKLDPTPPTIDLVKFQIDLFTIKFIAEVNDEASGVDYVEFSIDGVLQFNDTITPYEWTWSGFETFTVTAVVYDKAGNSQSQSMSTPYSYNTQKLFNPYQIQGYAMKYQMSQ